MSQTQTSIVAWPYTPQQRNVTRVRVGSVPLLRPRLRSLLRCLVPRASCLKDAGPHSSPLATHVLRRHRALFFFSLLLLLSPVFSLKSVRLSHERKKEEKEEKERKEREKRERERERVAGRQPRRSAAMFACVAIVGPQVSQARRTLHTAH